MSMQSMSTAALVLALAAAVAGEASAQARDPHAGHAGHSVHTNDTDHANHAAHSDHSERSEPPEHSTHRSHPEQSNHSNDPVQTDHSNHDQHDQHDQHDHHDHHDHHAGHAGHAASPGDNPLTPIPPLTDADRAAAFPALHHDGMQHPDGPTGYLAFNRLEAWDTDHGSGQAWEADGWYGGDIHRLWLRSEGERSEGRTGAANLELLYGRSVSPWWDVVAGIRHDFAPGSSQDWLAVGVQGLAPYLLEVSATAYLGESGRSMLGLEVEYELLLTNRLILQPMIEATVHGKADPARGIGSGLSTVEAGLRLRYEIHRRFAPYVGVVHERAFGDTAGLRRAAGAGARDTHLVAGLRFWF